MHQSFYLTTARELMQGRISTLCAPILTTETFHIKAREAASLPVAVATKSSFQTMTSYGGADLLVAINGENVGELQSIHYQVISPALAEAIASKSDYFDRDLVKEYPVVIVAVYAMFDREPVRGYDGEELDIVLTYTNEYGMASGQRIDSARVITISGGTAIDDVISERHVVMMAQRVTPLVKIS